MFLAFLNVVYLLNEWVAAQCCSVFSYEEESKIWIKKMDQGHCSGRLIHVWFKKKRNGKRIFQFIISYDSCFAYRVCFWCLNHRNSTDRIDMGCTLTVSHGNHKLLISKNVAIFVWYCLPFGFSLQCNTKTLSSIGKIFILFCFGFFDVSCGDDY